MPKNNIGNKRASSASTKKSGLKRRFDLTNRKVQFFVVIAIVAVLGGGYFTVRSFAAEATLYSFSANNALMCGYQSPDDSNSCKIIFADPNNKNSTKEVALAYSSATGVANALFATTSSNNYLIGGVLYSFCVTAKGSGQLTMNVQNGNNGYGIGGQVEINSQGYQRVCSRPASNQNIQPSGNYKIVVFATNKPALIKVTNLEILRDTPTPTAPAPPAK